uniref:Uncharacterized protein n=1 Tax=Euplotes harpa TaxID=151035 RepID=A0A7S3J918_9SPIT|mmetsp:Transcript_24101/g.27805  ORF Transcript_24101/g.27805 Transcript_24101/m.27805 type:complete len:317 (+) Transcript_24101:2-952(+)
MKTLVLVVAVSAVLAAYYAYNVSEDQMLESGFQTFINTYEKSYGSVEEYNFRFEAYKSNLNKIAEENRKNPQAHFAINQFGDFTDADMKKLLGYRGGKTNQPTKFTPTDVTPADWSHLWKNTVKNQGICGSCWTFSATAVFEARHAIKNGYTTEIKTFYSEQELIDCIKTKDSQGCNGGIATDAYEFLNHHQFCSQELYPYQGIDGTCQLDKCAAGPNDDGRTDLPSGDVNAVLTELTNGPVAVAVDATRWAFYTSGIVTDCDNELNHGVTLTKTDGSNFVQIRNSWGPAWGESGNIRLGINNVCGFADSATVPKF